MVEKGLSFGADLLFLDLEDAVAPNAKDEARKNVIHAISRLDWRGRRSMFCMKSLNTTYFYRDVIEVIEGGGEGMDL